MIKDERGVLRSVIGVFLLNRVCLSWVSLRFSLFKKPRVVKSDVEVLKRSHLIVEQGFFNIFKT